MKMTILVIRAHSEAQIRPKAFRYGADALILTRRLGRAARKTLAAAAW